MLFSEKARDKKFWEQVRCDSRYKFLVDELKEMYEKYASGEIADISYDAFMDYHKTGNRDLFEWEYYFPRRNRLNCCALLSLIYPDNEEYFTNLLNTIWAICNEYCWSLPNHTKNSEFEYNDIYIDLFAAETGFALSEIRFLLGDRMSVLVNERIHKEIEKRIINSFINNTYSFEKMHNNWAAVCAGSVGVAFMYERPDLFYSVKHRIDSAMDYFLSSFKADGVCREGVSYWQYGFGFYAAYAQRLFEFSKGEINLFDDDKIKKIAQFPSITFLSKNASVSYADGAKYSKRNIGVDGILREHYGDLIDTVPLEYYATHDNCARWAIHIESIVYFDPDLNYGGSAADKICYMEESAWFVKKNKEYGFTVKAGDNDEPHNHNDIGSFIFAKGGKQVFCDLGAGRYTRDYFTSETRYSIFCNRSKGHSVPIIDGKEQCAGADFFGKMETAENKVTVEMTNAYPKCTLSSLVREFEMGDKTVVLKDSYSFEEKCPVTERFVSYFKPETAGNTIKLGDTVCRFDDKKWSVSVSVEKHEEHTNLVVSDIYVIDFTPTEEDANTFTLEINI